MVNRANYGWDRVSWTYVRDKNNLKDWYWRDYEDWSKDYLKWKVVADGYVKKFMLIINRQ